MHEITPGIRREMRRTGWEGEQHLMQRAAGRAPASPVVPGLGVRVFLPRSPPAPPRISLGLCRAERLHLLLLANRAEKSEKA